MNVRTSLVLAWLAATVSVSSQTVITESFSQDPLAHGWRISGDTNLFHWDSTNQNLQVTWDSSRPNSYFYYPAGTILSRQDDFTLAFDLLLNRIGPGPDPAKTNSFQIALGFLNLAEATRTNFMRGTGANSPDLVEFDYFFDSGFGTTVWPTIVDTNSTFNYNSASDYAVFALQTGAPYHVVMNYTASNQTVVATVGVSNQPPALRISQLINTNFTDYRATVLSITSYSDAGQDPSYAGSVLAQGTIDNIVATVPGTAVQGFAGGLSHGAFQGKFTGRAGFVYTLQRSTNLETWADVQSATSGAGMLTVGDPSASGPHAFYRLKAFRP